MNSDAQAYNARGLRLIPDKPQKFGRSACQARYKFFTRVARTFPSDAKTGLLDMTMLSVFVTFAVRCLLIGLFLPFSALDKVLNFDAAIGQAAQTFPNRFIATLLIGCGLAVEIVMSLAILTGVADRLAAFVLAGYCMATALLWKRFWKAPDFRLKGQSRGRDVFWDFLKNFALAGGFLVLTFGTDASGVTRFIADPLASSHPYSTVKVRP